MDLDHLRAEYARQVLAKMGVIKDYGPIDTNKPVPIVNLNFEVHD